MVCSKHIRPTAIAFNSLVGVKFFEASSAARAAGMPVVAVDFGYTDVPVSELGPDRVISHFDALHEAVLSLTAPAGGR